MWITECGYDPYYAFPSVTDPTTALTLKAKSTARYFCFFLHKGCKKVTIFATGGGDARLGIVKDNFLSYCNGNTTMSAISQSHSLWNLTNKDPAASPAVLLCPSGQPAIGQSV